MATYTVLVFLASVVCLQATEETDVLAQLTVLANETVKIPCDLSTRGLADVALIVLWYRGASPAPFYSYDLRQTGGRHWSDETVFGQRAQFDLKLTPPSLRVSPVRPSDQDTYRCRVDYEHGPSKTSTVHLAVIVPPSPAVVTDESGSVVAGTAGPYLEGGRVILTCKTIGGRPSPTLVWLRDGRLVEDSYTVDHRGQVRNLLHLDNLSRQFLDATFTCRATNNNITQPLDTSVTINMTLAPLTISLLKVAGSQDYVSAGVTEELECTSAGSRPEPTMSWWRDSRRITNPSVQVRLVNKTVSTLRIVAQPSDHGVVYTCRVENPLLPTSVLEESYKLNVHYVPQVDLVMGMGIIPKSVKEGSDVFFECHVKSNPKFYKITWIHEPDKMMRMMPQSQCNGVQGSEGCVGGAFPQGAVIHHNVSAGIIVSNQSLVLQKVGRERAGRYFCRATNLHGEGVSTPITITIMYTPVCSPGQQREYQVAHHETANITCRVDAVPDNVTFTWKFNSSGSLLELGEGRAASWGTTSVLAYTPASPGDYGLLLCTATNSIGTQHLPCVINVTAAKPPDLLEECVIRNQTTHSVFVTCKGVPTELPRKFTMEVRNSEDLQLVTKVTNSTPHFVASGLDPGTAYTLHVAVHSPMGASTPIKLQAFTVKTAEKRMGISEPEEEVLAVSPLVAILAGGSVAVVITLVVIIGIAIKRCPRRRPPAGDASYAVGSHVSDTSPKETVSTFSRPSPASEERNPDLIPQKEGKGKCDYQLEELRVPSCQVVGGVSSCHQMSHGAPGPITVTVPVAGGVVTTCHQSQDWDAYYQHQLHHHHHHRHHHHHQTPAPPPPPSIASFPHPPCEVMGAPPLSLPEGILPPPNYSMQPPVSGAAYTTPAHFLGGGEVSSSPHLDPHAHIRDHTDYDGGSFRHESSV
ncbi:nephrin-like isoform X2 [Eriocheir sinensis]|uniref:nephrin-like isoform X2 n=1 Tax=Eriocheir sinensis TaxID=95602 RepID=UPI0021C5BBE7|nr:nephrin-like isoform X2 [Eriocheir sinensis]